MTSTTNAKDSGRFGKTRSKSVIVDPTFAKYLIDTTVWEKQRHTRPSMVKYYAEMMRNKEWNSGQPVQFIGVKSGVASKKRTICVDGQHRFSAVVMSNTTQEFTFITHIVEKEEDVAAIYAHIDHGLKKTPADRLKAFGVQDTYEWTTGQVNAARSAVTFVKGGFYGKAINYGRLTPTMELALVDEIADTANAYFEMVEGYCEGKVKKAALRRDCMSVGLVTLEESMKFFGETKVFEFWRGALTGEMLTKNDPRKKAYDHLLSSHISGGGGAKHSNSVTAEFSARYIAKCFNAHMRGDKPKYFRVIDSSRLIEIDGSRFDGITKYEF